MIPNDVFKRFPVPIGGSIYQLVSCSELHRSNIKPLAVLTNETENIDHRFLKSAGIDDKADQSTQTSRGMCLRNVGVQIIRKCRRNISGPWFMTVGEANDFKLSSQCKSMRNDLVDASFQTDILKPKSVQMDECSTQTPIVNLSNSYQQCGPLVVVDSHTQWFPDDRFDKCIQTSQPLECFLSGINLPETRDHEQVTDGISIMDTACQTSDGPDKEEVLIAFNRVESHGKVSNESIGTERALPCDVLDALMNFKPCPMLSRNGKSIEHSIEKPQGDKQAVTYADLNTSEKCGTKPTRSQSADNRAIRSSDPDDDDDQGIDFKFDTPSPVTCSNISQRSSVELEDIQKVNELSMPSFCDSVHEHSSIMFADASKFNNFDQYDVPLSTDPRIKSNDNFLYVTDNIASSDVIASFRSKYTIITINKEDIRLREPLGIDRDVIGVMFTNQLCLTAFEFSGLFSSFSTIASLFMSLPKRDQMWAVVLVRCNISYQLRRYFHNAETSMKSNNVNLTVRTFANTLDATEFIKRLLLTSVSESNDSLWSDLELQKKNETMTNQSIMPRTSISEPLKDKRWTQKRSPRLDFATSPSKSVKSSETVRRNRLTRHVIDLESIVAAKCESVRLKQWLPV
ncbi:hypothetical protein ACOME3_009463 [Neoechinorhynchus agilis]